MNLITKLITALRLLVTGDWSTFQRRYRVLRAQRKLRRAGGRPIVYQDFGFQMICHPDWPDSVGCFGHDDVDVWETQVMRRWLEPGDTALDFGANLGIYTFAAAAAVGREGRVFSIDADAFVIEKLRLSASILGTAHVTPVHRAITPETGTVTFYIRANRTDTGGQSLKPDEADLAACTAVTVPASTVPDLLAELRLVTRPALVKVDIEGAEGMLLATTPSAWFGADGPLWLLEVNPFTLAHFGLQARDIVNRFPSENFDCWLLSKHPLVAGEPVRLQRMTAATTFTDARYYNFFAIPRGAGWRKRAGRLAAFFPTA